MRLALRQQPTETLCPQSRTVTSVGASHSPASSAGFRARKQGTSVAVWPQGRRTGGTGTWHWPHLSPQGSGQGWPQGQAAGSRSRSHGREQ
jgi:hypothetical protein